jgi:peptide/nickel transport system substrate-binding protein
MSINVFNRLFSYLKLSTLLALLLLAKASASINDTTFNYQKMVQIAVTDIPFSLSPYASNGLELQYSHLFFDPLVRWGQGENLEFRLLTKLETLKNNKIRFYLKKNIYFHSGNLLTSKDVIWSLNEALKNKYLHLKLQHIIDIKRINEFQFDIKTKLSQDQLLDYLSHLFILDSLYYKNNSIDHNTAQVAISPPVKTLPLSGTGPYRVSSFYAGVNLRVQENVTYWQASPMFKSLNFVKIKSIDSRLYALLAGDIDISEAIANEQINSVYLLDGKQIYQTSSSNALFLMINKKKNDLFEREIVRNAIHLTINQVGMLKHILNGTGSINNTFKIDISSLEDPLYDAKRAQSIFKKVNAPKILSLLVMVDQNTHTKQVVVALENMFKKVSIQLKITEVKTVERWNKLQSTHDLMLSNWQTSLINKDNIYQSIFTNSTLSTFITLLFNQEKQSLTMQDKIKLFEEYQSSDYIIPLFSQNEIWATDKQFDLHRVFSANAIPYWHLLTISTSY